MENFIAQRPGNGERGHGGTDEEEKRGRAVRMQANRQLISGKHTDVSAVWKMKEKRRLVVKYLQILYITRCWYLGNCRTREKWIGKVN